MIAPALLRVLIEIYPEFSGWWSCSANYSRDGDSFSVHGLCSEFSSFFSQLPLPLREDSAARLYKLVEEIIAADVDSNDATANALHTCFLENIAHSAPGEASVPFMGPLSLKSFQFWHSGIGRVP